MNNEKRSIEEILQAFLPEERHSLALLHEVQKEYGHISAASLKAIATYLQVPVSKVFSVATFYDAFTIEQTGSMVIRICTGTTCRDNGSQKILADIEQSLAIKAGETTEDGLFSIETVHCLGACAIAPVVMCDDELFGDMNVSRAQNMVKKCKEKVEA